jgi:hypothetical protein
MRAARADPRTGQEHRFDVVVDAPGADCGMAERGEVVADDVERFSSGQQARRAMNPAEAINEDEQHTGALAQLNTSLAREGFEAYYAPDRRCYLPGRP